MNEYLWKILYFGTVIILLTLGCVIVLTTLGNVNEQIKQPNSFSVGPSGCYVYGDNIEYAILCKNLSKEQEFHW